ncbi:hypothetical protein ASG85_15370 [Paenibacillus sp. Soil724D2]|nr:hypothetical protein ASG85_15370 [Paenibacillus sp. Soil724D2]
MPGCSGVLPTSCSKALFKWRTYFTIFAVIVDYKEVPFIQDGVPKFIKLIQKISCLCSSGYK